MCFMGVGSVIWEVASCAYPMVSPHSILFYAILFYSTLSYPILFLLYSILFYSAIFGYMIVPSSGRDASLVFKDLIFNTQALG